MVLRGLTDAARGTNPLVRVGMVAVAMSLVPAVSACTGATPATAPEPSPAMTSPDAPAHSSPETSVATSPAPLPKATSPAPSPEEIVAECEAAPCDTLVVDRASTAYFHSPSNNITCSLSALEATCEINARSFASPPKPTDCQLDYGTMVSVALEGPASFVCHGDTGFVQATPFAPNSSIAGSGDVLNYGDEITNGVFVCSSSKKAMGCSTVAGEHGFTLSRARYRIY